MHFRTWLERYWDGLPASNQETSQWSGQAAYHGTNSIFQQFDIGKIGQRDWGDFGFGVYLTPSKTLASLYAQEAVKRHGGKPIILYCRLLVKKTANLDDSTLWEALAATLKLEPKQNQTRTPAAARAITGYLQQHGFDSAAGRKGKEIVVFNTSDVRVDGYYDDQDELILTH